MAEAVHFHIEQQLPELQDLLAKKIFDKEEVKEIVVKRTKFEYKLKRRISEKSDFTTYIQYEKELESLRRQRVDSLGIKGRHSTSDHSIRQHVYQLYKRAVSKFKGDVDLWLEYISYARETNGKTVLDRVFASALSLHPQVAPFWIGAAQWELEGKGNASAARVLLQKGVRAIPESVELWLAFFKFELDFASNLLARRQVLGIEDAASAHPVAAATSEHPAAAAASKHTVTAAAISLIVHRHSIQALPAKAELQEAFFALAQLYPQFPRLLPGMEANLRSNSKTSADPAIMRLLLGLRLPADMDSGSQLADILKEFGTMFPELTSPTALCEAVAFMGELVSKYRSDEAVAIALADKIDQIFQLGQDGGLLTPELYLLWLDLSTAQGLDVNDILVEARKRFPLDDGIAYKYAAHLVLGKAPLAEVLKALESVRTCDDPFWTLLLGQVPEPRSALKAIFGSIRTSVLHRIPFQDTFNRILALKGSLAPLCEELLSVAPVGAVVYPLWIGAERSAESPDTARIAGLYQKLLSLTPSDAETWMSLLRLTLEQGDLALAGVLFKKACAAVPDTAAFTLAYDGMLVGL